MTLDVNRPDLVVGVVGTGAMGRGIAQVTAQGGMKAVLFDAAAGGAAKAKAAILETLKGLVAKGRLTDADLAKTDANLAIAESLDALKACQVVVEAVFENLEVKQKLFGELEAVVSPETILASNTSSIRIASIARALKHRERVCGMHYFNPVPLMKLVEVVRTQATSEETVKTAWDLSLAMGKEPILAKDTPGFIFNRLIIPYLNEAIWAVYEGVGSASDVDRAMKLGGNMPIGPLALLDLIGIDVQLHACETLFEEFGDPKFRPCPLNRSMVRAGLHGKKTGKGFYDYSQDPPKPVDLSAM